MPSPLFFQSLEARLNRLLARNIADNETLDLLALCILEVAEKRHGDVRLTIKNGRITHISSTFSYVTQKDHVANCDPHYRSRGSRQERIEGDGKEGN